LSVGFRRFAWHDIEGIARLHRAAEQIDHAGRNGEAISLAQRWRRPDCDPEQGCLVADAEGQVVGYALRSAVPGTTQCILDGVVHPAWRRRGIGRSLLQRALERARRAGAGSADVRVRSDEPGAEAFCHVVGLTLARTWLRMWLQPLRPPGFGFPTGYGWRTFRPHADEALYAQVVNETMAGHWGTGPIAAERVAQMAAQPDFEPGNHLFALYGREVAGVCSARWVRRTVAGRDLVVAHLGPIGVLEVHRGCGVGRALVALSLWRCRRERIQAAELDVDEANAPAIHVYRDCGLEPLFRILWYRRELA